MIWYSYNAYTLSVTGNNQWNLDKIKNNKFHWHHLIIPGAVHYKPSGSPLPDRFAGVHSHHYSYRTWLSTTFFRCQALSRTSQWWTSYSGGVTWQWDPPITARFSFGKDMPERFFSVVLTGNKLYTVEPVLRDHEKLFCLEIWYFSAEGPIFQCNWTCHQRPPVLKDYIFHGQRVVFQDGFYCIDISEMSTLFLISSCILGTLHE